MDAFPNGQSDLHIYSTSLHRKDLLAHEPTRKLNLSTSPPGKVKKGGTYMDSTYIPQASSGIF